MEACCGSVAAGASRLTTRSTIQTHRKQVIDGQQNDRSEDQPHDGETERGSAAQGDALRKNRESPWHFRLYLNSPAANTLGPVRPRRRSIPESMANPKS